MTIVPEVTYSRTVQGAVSEESPIDPGEDVMASILAIPRGEPCRHGACSKPVLEEAHDQGAPQLVVAR